MKICGSCDIPRDASAFDQSSIAAAPGPGQEVVLARYELHRNHCGVLLTFAQFTDRFAADPVEVETPGYQWQIRYNGRPRDPYLTFAHVINPWGLAGFPLALRLDPGSLLELVVRRQGDDQGKPLARVGGRLVGRSWYDPDFGGASGRP